MDGIDWTRTAAQIDAQYRALRAALIAACEIVQADRAALWQSSYSPMLGRIKDVDDEIVIERYDAVLRMANAALGMEPDAEARG